MGRPATRGNYQAHPSPHLADKIRLVQGRRANNPKLIEAAYLVAGKWTTWRTTQTDDMVTAAGRSAQQYGEIVVSGHVPGKRTVAEVAAIVVRDLAEAERRAPIGKDVTPRLQRRIIEQRIVPDLGARDIVVVNDPDLLERWRVTLQGKDGRPLSRSALGNINSALQKINKAAHARGWLKMSQVHRVKQNLAPKGERRPSFSDSEIAILAKALTDEWVAAGHDARKREHRLMLRTMIYLIACTGVRPGLEIETLSPSQIRLDHRDGIYVHVRAHAGKHGRSRALVADERDPHFLYLHEVLSDYMMRHGTDPLFQRVDGKRVSFAVTFRRFLDEVGLRLDPITGRERTLYSLRHYYASKLLSQGVAPAEMARRMGTSIAMLDAHYYHGAEVIYTPTDDRNAHDNLLSSIRDNLPLEPADVDLVVYQMMLGASGLSEREQKSLSDLLRAKIGRMRRADVKEIQNLRYDDMMKAILSAP